MSSRTCKVSPRRFNARRGFSATVSLKLTVSLKVTSAHAYLPPTSHLPATHLHDGVLVYRSPLRKLDASFNQLRASDDNARASGKLLSARLAGIRTGSGQSTAGCVGLKAHPVKVARQVTSASKCRIARLPCVNQALRSGSLFLTVLLLKLLCAGCIVLPQFGDVLAVDGRCISVTTDKKSDAHREYRNQFPLCHLTLLSKLCNIHNVDHDL